MGCERIFALMALIKAAIVMSWWLGESCLGWTEEWTLGFSRPRYYNGHVPILEMLNNPQELSETSLKIV